MLKPKRIVIGLLGLALGSSCYGEHTYTHVTELRPLLMKKKELIAPEFYFGDAKPARPFTEIALIEVVGNRSAAEDEILVRLKHKAATIGADAVIRVQKQYKTREQGDLTCGKDCEHTYGAMVISGTAVVYGPTEAGDVIIPKEAP